MHTPGPWRLECEVHKNNTPVYWVWSQDNKVIFMKVILEPEDSKNIILASSAPKLLEACKDALKYNDEIYAEGGYGLPEKTVDLLRSAIAEAEGK
jgi:hypothetical protein